MSQENNDSPLPTNRHELDKIRIYEAKGFTANYKMEGDMMYNTESGNTYSLDDVTIVEEFRYEGMSNPDDLSILYALEMNDNSKGLILRPYGADANEEVDIFLSSVPRN